MRGISEGFINELNEGILKELLVRVKKDDTLDLQIREDAINIYYRGGNLLRIADTRNGEFTFFFDKEYLKGKENRPKSSYKEPNNKVGNADQCSKWIEQIPAIKESMDFWFSEHPKLEREMQQVVIRENNHSSISNGTDFFIADMEYAGGKGKGYRFDMVGIRWTATGAERKKNRGLIPCFIEMKYGDGALGGVAGIEKHFRDMAAFLKDDTAREGIYQEIESMLTQKQQLDLFDGINAFKNRGEDPTVGLDRESKPYYILILANTNPRSKRLENALVAAGSDSLVKLKEVAEVRFAKAFFMGYGLYEEYFEEI